MWEPHKIWISVYSTGLIKWLIFIASFSEISHYLFVCKSLFVFGGQAALRGGLGARLALLVRGQRGGQRGGQHGGAPHVGGRSHLAVHCQSIKQSISSSERNVKK